MLSSHIAFIFELAGGILYKEMQYQPFYGFVILNCGLHGSSYFPFP